MCLSQCSLAKVLKSISFPGFSLDSRLVEGLHCGTLLIEGMALFDFLVICLNMRVEV